MIEKLTKDILEKIILEINKIENKQKIKNYIITPIFKNFFPYFIIIISMYIINLILILLILLILLSK